MFLSRNKKNNVHPCKPQFYYIKVGFKGVKIIWVCFRDVKFVLYFQWKLLCTVVSHYSWFVYLLLMTLLCRMSFSFNIWRRQCIVTIGFPGLLQSHFIIFAQKEHYRDEQIDRATFSYLDVYNSLQMVCIIYSRTSIARTPMARLPRLIRTRFWVPAKFFRYLQKTNI